jgi:hypothetical protein
MLLKGCNSPVLEKLLRRYADRDKAPKVYDSLAHLRVGEGWIWAPDHGLLERVKFPPISTLDTSKTPKAGDVPITTPVPAGSHSLNDYLLIRF